MVQLNEFLAACIREYRLAENLFSVVQSIVQACVRINSAVSLGALVDAYGDTDSINVQGERQKKLDVIAHELLLKQLRDHPYIAGCASEEEAQFINFHRQAPYLVLFDPLDGSSNIDINISVGTIFSVLSKGQGQLTEQDFLQVGRKQLVAGYVLYGPQTILAITFGQEVALFTLNNQGQFVLTRERVKVPVNTQEFAINASNYRYWEDSVRAYIDELLAGKEGSRAKNYNMRWVASMVAEVHRILTRGGILLYPRDSRRNYQNGKLRLLYEASPMSLLIESAGGMASDGMHDILSIQPTTLHQRTPVILGAKEEVERITNWHQQQIKQEDNNHD